MKEYEITARVRADVEPLAGDHLGVGGPIGTITSVTEVLTAEDAMREIAALWSRDHQGSEMKAIIDRWKASQ